MPDQLLISDGFVSSLLSNMFNAVTPIAAPYSIAKFDTKEQLLNCKKIPKSPSVLPTTKK